MLSIIPSFTSTWLLQEFTVQPAACCEVIQIRGGHSDYYKFKWINLMDVLIFCSLDVFSFVY